MGVGKHSMSGFRECGHESASQLYPGPAIPKDRLTPERGTCRSELVYDRTLQGSLSSMEESITRVEGIPREVPELLVEGFLSICI